MFYLICTNKCAEKFSLSLETFFYVCMYIYIISLKDNNNWYFEILSFV